MGRRRKRNSHLPARVYESHGAYYFVDVVGRWHNLGRTLPEMYRHLADLVEDRPLQTMRDLFQKYRFEVLPQKAPRTQIEDARYLTRLDKVFGKMLPGDILARHIYAYRHVREHAGKTTANHELGVLKHVFTKAVEWGDRKSVV